MPGTAIGSEGPAKDDLMVHEWIEHVNGAGVNARGGGAFGLRRPEVARAWGCAHPPPLAGMGSALGGHGGGSENLREVGEGRCLDRMASLGPVAEGGRAQNTCFPNGR